MPWIKRKFRGNVVFVRVNANGEPTNNEKGLVEVVYKMAIDSKIYNASFTNLMPTGKDEDEKPFETKDAPQPGVTKVSPAKKSSAPKSEPDAIIIYTDGACSGNPGPMGIGAVIMRDQQRFEISEFLGNGTNNIAELIAIERALQAIPENNRARQVLVHSDSSYSINILTKGWKAKANVELIKKIRALTKEFSNLHFVKVKGHAGIPENERCDELATAAVAQNS